MSLALMLALCYLIGILAVGVIYCVVRRDQVKLGREDEPLLITIRDGVLISLFWPFYVFALFLSVV